MSIILKTYLTPGIPQEIFVIIANYLEEECNLKINLEFETNHSGPKSSLDMKEDIAFMCILSYYLLTQKCNNQIELIPWAPVFNDYRNCGLPLCFTDILVNPNNRELRNLEDLNNHIWAYDNAERLNEYHYLKNKYKNKIKMICSGSHLNSIQMVKDNKADITCVDSNFLLFLNHGLKRIGTLGPHPIQPCVIKQDCVFKDKIINAFSTINEKIGNKLQQFFINKFGRINKELYNDYKYEL